MGYRLDEGGTVSDPQIPLSRALFLEDRCDKGARWAVGGRPEPLQRHLDILLASGGEANAYQDANCGGAHANARASYANTRASHANTHAAHANTRASHANAYAADRARLGKRG